MASREERKNALAEGKLCLADNLDTVLLDFGRQINRYLAALPLRVKRRYPDFANLTDSSQKRLHKMIEDEIRQHLNLMPDVARLRSAEIILDDGNLAEADEKFDRTVAESLGTAAD